MKTTKNISNILQVYSFWVNKEQKNLFKKNCFRLTDLKLALQFQVKITKNVPSRFVLEVLGSTNKFLNFDSLNFDQP